MSDYPKNKETVVQAMIELFVDLDVTAVDRWIDPGYIQHNPRVPDGPDGLSGFVAALPPQFEYRIVRVLADRDLVAVHGVYNTGAPGGPLVAFDVFRLRDGKLAEHWDALTPLLNYTASGRSQVDGPTEVTQPEHTDQNHNIVAGFVQTVLIGGRTERITDYLSTAQYHQHNPVVGDGLHGLTAVLTHWADRGIVMSYETLHQVVADGEFVLSQSEGSLGGKPTAFYDLFRIQEGMIVEHWDVINEIPDTFAHDNGMF